MSSLPERLLGFAGWETGGTNVGLQIGSLRRGVALVMPTIKRGGGVGKTIRKVLALYRREGLAGIGRALRIISAMGRAGAGAYGSDDYARWIRRYDTLTERDRALMRARIAGFAEPPLISVVMPIFNPALPWLEEAIASVRQQIYPHWELCIADDASSDSAAGAVLERLAAADPRIKLVLRTTNGHIAAASNSALELARGGWIALLDHDDRLSEAALFWVAAAINAHPDAGMIYSDEDKLDAAGQRCDPYFKCDWNEDLFRSQNLISHLGVYRAATVREVGGFREGLEGSQDYDLALRCAEKLAPRQILHIPRVSYHWRMHPESAAQSATAKPYAALAGERALNDHFKRRQIRATAEFIGYGYRTRYALPEIPPRVSLIIPVRNQPRLISTCVDSILEKTTYCNFEILIVDNASDDPVMLDYLDRLRREARVKVIHDPRPFNYAAMNNAAVKFSGGAVLGLLNSDLEVIGGDWLSEMVAIALQPKVAAVGARLWYPDQTLQHGGVILGLGAAGVAGHAHDRMPRYHHGSGGRAALISSFSAVSAACMVIRKEIFEELGGLDETNLAVAFNDVDLCLRARARNYRNVWTPFAELYHHESASRGSDAAADRRAQFAAETAFMKLRWGDLLLNDPAYSPNLALDRGDFSLAWPPRVAPP